MSFPVGACDTHMHIYDDRYPVAPSAILQPPAAAVADYRVVQSELGLDRVVVVQPTTYGLDNACTLDAVAAMGSGARAIVVVDGDVTRTELDRLTRLGSRGARFHLLPGGAVGWDALASVASRIEPFGWHVQVQMNGRDLADRVELLASLPVPVVIDHVGRYMPPVDVDDARLTVLLHLLDTGRVWVKLSAPYESSPDPTHRYHAVGRLVRSLVERAPQRMLWATNWPHPGQAEPPSPADLHRLALGWMPDAALRQRILVDNPAELYGFDPVPCPPVRQ